MITVIRDALIALLISVTAAIAVNAFRDQGLAWVARQDYQILVPCPEPMGEATALDPAQAWPPAKGDLTVDSRTKEEYGQWHPEGALWIPFDYLAPVSDENLQSLVSSGARRIIVIGDGRSPDSGEELAKELSGRGVRNVHFVRGGADALKKQAEG